jgi:hypothetical protein
MLNSGHNHNSVLPLFLFLPSSNKSAPKKVRIYFTDYKFFASADLLVGELTNQDQVVFIRPILIMRRRMKLHYYSITGTTSMKLHCYSITGTTSMELHYYSITGTTSMEQSP